MRLSRLALVVSLLCSIALFQLPANAQTTQARCAFCQWVPCGAVFSGVCQAGAVHDTCNRGAQDPNGCYPNCESNLGCNTHASAGDCLKELQQLHAVKFQTDQQTEDAEDEAIRPDLIQNGTRATKLIPQLDAPAMLMNAVHNNRDLFKSGKLISLSDKEIVGVRIGYSISSPNTAKERKAGEWVRFLLPLKRNETANIPAQNIDSAILGPAGTIINFYMAEVKFQDGSVWHIDTKPGAKTTAQTPIDVTNSKSRM